MLSEALRLIRVFHDMKQSELAAQLGVSKSHLSEIESGRKTPSLDLAKRYAEAFDLPLSSILFFAERLDGSEGDPGKLDRARGVIAEKILNFLKLVEARRGLS